MTDVELIARLLAEETDLTDCAVDRIEALTAKLKKAVEAAFYEGFCEGRDGGWVWGDPTPAWKKSDTLAEIKGESHE